MENGIKELEILVEVISTKSILTNTEAYAVNTAIAKLQSILNSKPKENEK